ncbi:hypothetical protein AVEN_85391-1 [Araneus ventricosus]|uniref:Uncharacterized protein n=1 Tax=Araneus ventricosus TaxID=182803 RepID=A0A4Y2WNY3_ARAVE|nr:hypothetical protein AVEN_15169-1 [Araneus ventricosus]GBO38783.1 hypothetical protein AVEN_85391-1 [Araneus ventricosus]
MTNGVPKREIQPFSKLSATVSARILDTGISSVQRLYRSMIVKQNRNPSDDDRTPPYVPVPDTITASVPVGWIWDFYSRQCIGNNVVFPDMC